jgi:hypothetical protein
MAIRLLLENGRGLFEQLIGTIAIAQCHLGHRKVGSVKRSQYRAQRALRECQRQFAFCNGVSELANLTANSAQALPADVLKVQVANFLRVD